MVIDAAEIFLDLCKGEYLDFPSIFEEQMNTVGEAVCDRAISERRNVVCGIVGDDYELTKRMIEALKYIGYIVNIEAVTLDFEESSKRNLNRGDDDISSYYTQHYHLNWLAGAMSRSNPQ